MKTIAIDASRANKAKKTGVEWYSFDIIQALKKITPDDLRVILYSGEPLKGKLAELPKNWESRVLNWPPKYLWTQIRLAWDLWLKRKEVDLIFFPAHTIPFFCPVKAVITIHDIGFDRFPELYKWIQIVYHRLTIKDALKKAVGFIVPSKFTENEIRDVYIYKKDNIKVIYHGFEKGLYRIANESDLQTGKSVLEKYQIKKPYLFYIGRIEEKKNITKLIEAFNLIKDKYNDLSLVLVGQPGYNYEKFIEKIKEYGLEKKVIFPGWVEQVDIPYFYQQTKVFVFPTLYEGFGMPLLEAMTCGCPILTSNISSLPEVGADAVMYCNPKDPKDIADKISQMLENNELSKNFVQRGLERKDDFSWEKAGQETLDFLLKNC